MENSKEFIKTIYRTQRQYKYMVRTWPDLVHEIELNCQDDIPWPEKLYLFQEGLHHRPKCHCGRECTFISPTKGYTRTCSPACASQSGGEKFEKIKSTMMERYGVAHALQSDELRAKRRRTNLKRHGDESYNNRDKYKKTSIERYGGVGGAALSIKDKVIRTTTERYGGMGLASEFIRNKAARTNLERYGVENPAQSTEIRKKIIATTLERYGVDNPTKSSEIKERVKNIMDDQYGGMGLASSNIRKKIIATTLERYGVDNPTKSSEIKERVKRTNKERHGGTGTASEAIRTKIIKTNIERYGVKNASQHSQIAKKISKGLQSYMLENTEIPIIQYNPDGTWRVACTDPTCNKCDQKWYVTNTVRYHDRIRQGLNPCTVLYPINPIHNKNTYIEQFIQHILDDHNIRYTTNDRNIIAPAEVDIYLPDYKIAIECNGIYWHSSEYKDRNYHYNKWLECKKHGIQLLTIWEDWVANKPQIVESVLLSKLGIYQNKIGARQCDIVEVDSKIARQFLDNNHIQGFVNASIYIGLVYGNALVGLMTFGKKRGASGRKGIVEGEWELSRFCTVRSMQIVSGAQRLLTYFIRQYQPKRIISFSCNDISNGNLYIKLGFTEERINQAYWYIDKKMHRYHRSAFTKARIVAKGWKESRDKSWTEAGVVAEHGYYRLDDCGQIKWVMNL